MEKDEITREQFIKQALYIYRNGWARRFYFDNEDVPFVAYYYDPNDDSLHADGVSVPFHYEKENITNEIIGASLASLKKKLREYYKKEKGINLYDYD